jgi:hypothetical protein
MAQAGHAYTTSRNVMSLLHEAGFPAAWMSEATITVTERGAFVSAEHMERLRYTTAFRNLQNLIASNRIVARETANGVIFTLTAVSDNPARPSDQPTRSTNEGKTVYVAPYMRRDGVRVSEHYKRPRRPNGKAETEPAQIISIRVHNGKNGKMQEINLTL